MWENKNIILGLGMGRYLLLNDSDLDQQKSLIMISLSLSEFVACFGKLTYMVNKCTCTHTLFLSSTKQYWKFNVIEGKRKSLSLLFLPSNE